MFDASLACSLFLEHRRYCLYAGLLTAWYLYCASLSSFAGVASPPPPLSGVTTTIAQYPPNAPTGGFDNDVNTLFHSALGTAAGYITLTFENPTTLTSLTFLAQQDPAGQPLLNRLPCFVSIRCPPDGDGQGASTPLISPVIDPRSGSALLSLERYRLTGSTFILYLRSRADCLTFSECYVRGNEGDSRGAVDPVTIVASALLMLSMCVAVVILRRSCRHFSSREIITNAVATFTWARVAAFLLKSLNALGTPSVGYRVVCGALACSAFAYYGAGLHISGIDCTGIQAGDGLWFLAVLKSCMNDFRWWRGAEFGAPLFSDMRDFAAPDFLHMFISVTLAKLFDSVQRSFWLYYIASFGLTYSIAFIVYRRLSVTEPIAHVLAFGYSFLPYHMVRLGHYGLAMYYTLPIAVLAAVSLTKPLASLPAADATTSPELTGRIEPRQKVRMWILAVDCLMALGGAYYCVWYLLLLGYTAVFNLMAPTAASQRLTKCLMVCGHIGITICIFTCATFPFRSIDHELGPNPDGVSKRLVLESDVYATSLAFMITPSVQSRLAHLLGRTTFPPFSTVLPPGESIGAYIGMPGSLGVLMSCVLILSYVQKIPQNTGTTTAPDAANRFLAPLTLYLFLWATFGGFNAVFANIVSTQIRCWNRLSVLLSFVAAGVFGIAISRTLEYVRQNSVPEMHRIVVMLIVMTLGSCIAITQLHPWTDPQTAHQRCTLDQQSREYFGSIVARPVHAERPMILMLPYMGHPEAALPEGIGHYAYFLPYLHSDGMRISFGGCRGRPAGEAYRLIASLEPPKAVAAARRLGFTGILICQPSIHEKLLTDIGTALGKNQPLMSADGVWAYFDLEESSNADELSEADVLDISGGGA